MTGFSPVHPPSKKQKIRFSHVRLIIRFGSDKDSAFDHKPPTRHIMNSLGGSSSVPANIAVNLIMIILGQRWGTQGFSRRGEASGSIGMLRSKWHEFRCRPRVLPPTLQEESLDNIMTLLFVQADIADGILDRARNDGILTTRMSCCASEWDVTHMLMRGLFPPNFQSYVSQWRNAMRAVQLPGRTYFDHRLLAYMFCPDARSGLRRALYGSHYLSNKIMAPHLDTALQMATECA